MKKILGYIAIILTTVVNLYAQNTDRDQIELIMSHSQLIIELPKTNNSKELIDKPSSKFIIYIGINEQAEKPIRERTFGNVIPSYTKINPEYIIESNVRSMLNNHWQYYFQQIAGSTMPITGFKVSNDQLALIHSKKISEVTLVVDKNTPSLFLTKLLYDLHTIGEVKKVFLTVKLNDDKIAYKPLTPGRELLMNPYKTYGDWANSNFQSFDEKSIIIEAPDNSDESEEIEIDLDF